MHYHRQMSIIAIAGDWHGNESWARRVITAAREQAGIILQAGDFGVWDRAYLAALDDALGSARLWFCEGNHEDYELLAELAGDQPYEDTWITPKIRWLRRGTRWAQDGRTWLALGGAVSVDKLLRTPGRDWFPGETVTREDMEKAMAGPADVLLSHDAPVSAPLELQRPAPRLWQPMLPAAERHRELLEEVCQATGPAHVFHGHYHRSGRQLVTAPWGDCTFTALDMDGEPRNWGLLDTGTMEWEWK